MAKNELDLQMEDYQYLPLRDVVRRHKKTNTEKITLPRPIILGDMHGAEVFFL